MKVNDSFILVIKLYVSLTKQLSQLEKLQCNSWFWEAL